MGSGPRTGSRGRVGRGVGRTTGFVLGSPGGAVCGEGVGVRTDSLGVWNAGGLEGCVGRDGRSRRLSLGRWRGRR